MRAQPIGTILFDIGGVLTHDGHETYLSHDTYGIARQLGLSKRELSKRSAPVFRKYAVLPRANEADFWSDIEKALDTSFSNKAIQTAKRHIRDANNESTATFNFLQEKGINIGIISNSTPFFYPMIAKQLSLARYVRPELYFLSHLEGCLKSNGLFEIAASKLNPAQTFIIDDRAPNIAHAKKLGFKGALYSRENGTSLLALITRVVNQPKQGARS